MKDEIESEDKVKIEDVFEEFSTIAEEKKIPTWRGKPVEKNYAFELPNIPSKATYLEVGYPFSCNFKFLFFSFDYFYYIFNHLFFSYLEFNF